MWTILHIRIGNFWYRYMVYHEYIEALTAIKPSQRWTSGWALKCFCASIKYVSNPVKRSQWYSIGDVIYISKSNFTTTLPGIKADITTSCYPHRNNNGRSSFLYLWWHQHERFLVNHTAHPIVVSAYISAPYRRNTLFKKHFATSV